MDAITDILGPTGLLARQITGFMHRPQQVEMAVAVMQAIEQQTHLIAEAGTGTGKTFAYLTPALLSGMKVIISTGTRNLQDQLFLRDLPRLQATMASPAKIALLKGRANYLCHQRLESALRDARGQPKDVLRWLLQVQDWAQHTTRGDIAELSGIPEDATVWPQVTSTIDNCLGQECPHWKDCHLVEARRQAQEADIVVINHHLLCADLSLKESGFGELLPAADVFIVDEAHQLADIAGGFFGDSLSSRQLLEFIRDTLAAYYEEAGDLADFPVELDQLKKATYDLRLAFNAGSGRHAWAEITDDTAVQTALDQSEQALHAVHKTLELIAGRGKQLAHCQERCQEISNLLQRLRRPEGDAQPMIRWFELFSQSIRLHLTPLNIADLFSNRMADYPASWIFTSATLAVGENFTHFQHELGLHDVPCQQWDSPFDFAQQALWYVPRNPPLPHEPRYVTAILDAALPLIRANQGRAFLLFTSYRALHEAADRLHQAGLEFPILVQGDAPKGELIAQFVEQGHAILLGTASFWEGVDVRGDALSLVVIDKLPFASPGDPVLQARLDAIRASGENPFITYQVPQAAITLKQGAGRLIRDATDRGIFMLCDPRLLKKSYGHTFLAAMPDFARTRDPEVALNFIHQQ
ncbi:MAG: ATP-dependent DNA helicase [Pseudomonadota bacterium]